MRLFRNLSPVVAEHDIPHRNWFAQKPQLLFDIRGERAEALIPQIAAAIKSYPYPKVYHYWPGPNSNSFTAYIARSIPGLGLALPSNALGKDFINFGIKFTQASSHSGYQFSVFGLFGLILARVEGLEIDILGLNYGISLKPFTLKLPGIGDIVMGKK